jgi:hypothetical protein
LVDGLAEHDADSDLFRHPRGAEGGPAQEKNHSLRFLDVAGSGGNEHLAFGVKLLGGVDDISGCTALVAVVQKEVTIWAVTPVVEADEKLFVLSRRSSVQS